MVLTYLRLIYIAFVIFLPTMSLSQTAHDVNRTISQRHHVLYTVNGIMEHRADVTDEHVNGTIVIPTEIPVSHVDVVYWLHGKYGYNEHDLDKRLSDGSKLLGADCVNNKKFVIVMPKLPWAMNNISSGNVSSAVTNFNVYHNTIVALLSSYGFITDDVYILAYSAGGNIILRLSRSCRTSYHDVKYHVYLIDANYKDRLQILWNNCSKSDMFEKITVVTREYGDTRENADRFFKSNQTNSKIEHIILNGKSHIKMGDASYNVLYDHLCNDKDKK